MKKGIKILIAVIAVIVVLAGTAAGLFFGGIFDLMKPTRKTWTKQVQKALNLDGVKLTDYADTLEDYKDAYNKPFKANYTMTADLSISELDEEVQKTINNSKIKVEMAQDRKEKNSYAKVELESKDSKVLDVEYVANGEKLGIASKDIYDKYLSLSIADLEDYLKKSGEDIDLPGSTKSISELYNKASEIDAYQLLYISKDDLKDIQKTYKDVFKKSIDKKCWTKKANVKVDVDGKDVRATGYYLTLSNEDAKKLIEDLSDTIADDDTIAKIIVEKYNIIADVIGEDKIDSDDAKELIKSLTEQLKEASKSLDSKQLDGKGLQIAVYSKFNKPVRLELNYIEDMDDIYDGKTILSIEYGKKKDIYTILPDELGFVITDSYDKKTDKEKSGTLTVTVNALDGDLAKIDYEIVNKDSEKKVVLDAKISETLTEKMKLDGDINARLEFSANGNWKKEPVNMVFALKGNYGKEKAEVKIEGSVEYTDDVSIPTLNSDNSVDILKLNSEEQAKLLDEILKKASEVLPERLKTIGVDVKPEQIYKTKTVTTPTNSNTTITEADEYIEGQKEASDATLGSYTEIIRAGYKDDKLVSIGVAMEFADEEKAKSIYTVLQMSSESLEGFVASQEGKRIILTMSAEAFKEQESLTDDQLTKENIKKVFEQEGYTVK